MSAVSYEEILNTYRKLGYTEEASKWYDPMLPTDPEAASQFLQEAIKEYLNRA